MTKEHRKKCEELSLKAFGNKNYYRKVEKTGLLYRDPVSKKAARIKLTDEGILLYLEKTIAIREEALKELEAKDVK